MLNLKGCGLPNVYLADGYHEIPFEGETAVSYSDLDGLYTAIARAVAMSAHAMTGGEVRFLRKRMGWNQAQLGAALGKKSGQAVAKWEKDETPVPRLDANFLRLAWLDKHLPGEVAAAVRRSLKENVASYQPEYVFMFAAGTWMQTDRKWTHAAIDLSNSTIEAARLSGYSLEKVVDVKNGNGDEH